MGKNKKHKSHKSKKEKKRERKRRSSTSSSDTENEWVEREVISTKSAEDTVKREEWLSLPTNFTSKTNTERRREREEIKRIEKLNNTYNPRENVRELNPYWKNGGDGLPAFKKPTDKETITNASTSYGRWKKRSAEESYDSKKVNDFQEVYTSEDDDHSLNQLTDKEINVLAAKLVKAEIMGNVALVKELKEKLEKAREVKNNSRSNNTSNNDVLLTTTDSKGFTRPLKQPSSGEYAGSSKRQKVETHSGKERIRYFADDDKYSLKEMFENEKYNSIEEQNSQFIKLAGKVRKNDDLEDIFTDNIRQLESVNKKDKRDRDKAISEHKRISDCVDRCSKCINSQQFAKHLIINLGESMYISLPEYQPLTEGHCIISSIRHVSCGTQLDENEWSELINLRKLLTNMFSSLEKDVIFFETAKNLHKYPHMFIECVPVEREVGDTAPIYFKKAIDESETEWSSNKKLIKLSGRDVRKAVPKGLPYFSVSFGMQEGYAHVIEDRQYFPDNFAQEIIGGMLDLPHDIWRKHKHENFDKQSQRVVEFTKLWKDFEKNYSK